MWRAVGLESESALLKFIAHGADVRTSEEWTGAPSSRRTGEETETGSTKSSEEEEEDEDSDSESNVPRQRSRAQDIRDRVQSGSRGDCEVTSAYGSVDKRPGPCSEVCLIHGSGNKSDRDCEDAPCTGRHQA
jgi:hypothetical protein